MRCVLLLAVLSVSFSLYGEALIVNTEGGEDFVFDVDFKNESLQNVIDMVEMFVGDQERMLIEVPSRDSSDCIHLCKKNVHRQGQYLGHPRSYEAGVTTEERADIRFIVTTLANKTLLTIAMDRGDLEAAGDRIDAVHPLCFLRTVFEDEELKACIRNIRGKGWIWNNFIGGVKDSLQTESGIGNMKAEYLQNMAKVLKVSPHVLFPAMRDRKWDTFIDLLITHVPRGGDHGRYDC